MTRTSQDRIFRGGRIREGLRWMTDAEIDEHLDKILRAAGSALKNYTMQKQKDDMRQAMREALSSAWIAGSDAGWKAAREELNDQPSGESTR